MAKRSKTNFKRQGAATIELAIVLPVLMLITFGTLEICEGILLRQKVEIAAHEGARAAIRPELTLADAQAAVAEYLDARSIEYGNIADAVEIFPAPEDATTLQPINVTVTVNASKNFRMPLLIYNYWSGNEITSEVVMLKEYENE